MFVFRLFFDIEHLINSCFMRGTSNIFSTIHIHGVYFSNIVYLTAVQLYWINLSVLLFSKCNSMNLTLIIMNIDCQIIFFLQVNRKGKNRH